MASDQVCFVLCILPIILEMVYTVSVCKPKDQCSCQFDDGLEINLWLLDQKWAPRFKNIPDQLGRAYVYSYSPCSPFTSAGEAGQCKNVLGCRNDVGGGNPVAIAYPSNPHVSFDDVSEEYAFTYNGSHTNSSDVRQLIIKLKCNPKARNPRVEPFLQTNGNTYTTTLITKIACPVMKKRILNIEVIVCIVLVCGISAYCVLGMLFNKFVNGENGTDVIPQKKLWDKLIHVIKNCSSFTARNAKRKDYEHV